MCALPTVHSGASGVRLVLSSKDRVGVSQAFAERGPGKPGDPPQSSRPSAAKASDRTRSLSRPDPGLRKRKETVMISGYFIYSSAQDTHTGEVATLTLAA